MSENIIKNREVQSQAALESTVLSKHTSWAKLTGGGLVVNVHIN